MQSATVSEQPIKLTTGEIFKMVKDVSYLFPNLSKRFIARDYNMSQEKLSKITAKLKSDEERQKRYKEGTLTENDRYVIFKKLVKKTVLSRDSVTFLNKKVNVFLSKNNGYTSCFSENWYPFNPPSKLFKDPTL
jgi:hypothetical protein